ncbi:hypothetical protein [Nocardia spumae]|uniref:hypothetical protein n=1 Tax=Nocardia spumae TaxID=2887190 RepID=UPI001D1454DF|nr:hypothetical protein [Nocardia spumae]
MNSDANRNVRFAAIDRIDGKFGTSEIDAGSRPSREPVRTVDSIGESAGRNYIPQPEQPAAPPEEMVQADFRSAKSKS